jgi:hypothetical protein
MKMLTGIDFDIGQFIYNVTKKDDNSFVFLLSDHGIHYGNFFDKKITGNFIFYIQGNYYHY